MNRTKRVLSLALAIGMALSLLVIPANAASFTDTTGHWAEKMIEQAVAHGYVPAGGAFEPNKAITRNEFARMVNGAFGLTAAANISFKDVAASDPYYKDVQKAVSAGYIAGYEDNTFRGTNLITRQEAAVIIARLVAHPANLSNMNTLTDASSIAAWAQPAAKAVFTKGYMVGDNLKKFNPLGNLTRAETVKILETILSKEKIISGNVTMFEKNQIFSHTVYTGNVIVSAGIDRSSVQLTNCKVLGTLMVNGGGESGVRLSNTGVANLTVDSAKTTVGVAAVGDSTVYNTYLKTPAQLAEANLSGMGAGFKNVTIGGTAANVSLAGNYDKVAVTTPATVSLESGKTTDLGIAATAVGSSVKVGAAASINTTTVNATTAFTGARTIHNAVVNAAGVSFQEAPGSTSGTGANSSIGTNIANALAYTTNPVSGATQVATTSNIAITFEDVILPTNGQILTTSWVRENVVLRENTSTGVAVNYAASISQSGKVLTIDPVAALKTGTEYLLTVNPNAFKGTATGKINTAIAVGFSTAGKSSSSSSSRPSISIDDMEPVFYPGDETDNLPLDANLTLTFDEKIYDDEGKTLTASYLKNYVIELRKNSESGTSVGFSASINSAKKVITINPTSNLSKNTTYYLIVADSSLTNADGDNNDELVYSFTTTNSSKTVPLATPASGSTVETDTDFQFHFEGGIYQDNGTDLTSTYIENYVFEIREGSKTGTKIGFEADIDSYDETITLVTDELLDDDETYYILMDGDDLSDGTTDLDDLTFVYYAGDVVVNNNTTVTGDLAPIETAPEHKETRVDGSDNIKMLFSEDLYTEAGKKVTSAYLEDCIEIRRSSQTGRTVKFDAVYDTTYGLDVVELDPKSNLSSGYTYYVIVKEGTLFDKEGLANDKYMFYFTVGTSSSNLAVAVDAGTTSATLEIDYDYYSTDADSLDATLYYRKDGTSSWTTKAISLSGTYGTKTVTLSNLSRNEVYEYELEIDLYDGYDLLETDTYSDTFETDGYGYSGDIAISSITVTGTTGSYDTIYAEDFYEDSNGYFEGELYDTIEPASSMSSYGRLKIKVNTDDTYASVYVESDNDYDYGGDNETLYIDLSSDEYYDGYTTLYITVEDYDGYTTEYVLYVGLY